MSAVLSTALVFSFHALLAFASSARCGIPRSSHHIRRWGNGSGCRKAKLRRACMASSSRDRSPARHQERAHILQCHGLAARASTVQSRPRGSSDFALQEFGALSGTFPGRQLLARPGHWLVCGASIGRRRKYKEKREELTTAVAGSDLLPLALTVTQGQTHFAPLARLMEPALLFFCFQDQRRHGFWQPRVFINGYKRNERRSRVLL